MVDNDILHCIPVITHQGVDMFGRGIGFIKFRADVLDNETGQKVKQILMFFLSFLIFWNLFLNSSVESKLFV